MTKQESGAPSAEKIAKMIGRLPASLTEIEALLFPLIQYFDPHYHGIENVAAGKPTMMKRCWKREVWWQSNCLAR